MAQGKKWSLTDKRRDTVMDMLMGQASINLISMYFKIKSETLSKELKNQGIDYKELQVAGVRKLRQDLYMTLGDIEEPKDRAKAQLDFLKHYDKSDDVAVDKNEVTVVDSF